MGAAEQSLAGERFAPIHVEALDCRSLPIDLYIRHGPERMVLYRAAGVAFMLEDVQRLLGQGIDYLYISTAQYGLYRRLLVEQLHVGFQDESVPRTERVQQARTVCRQAIEGAISAPSTAESVETVAAVSRAFADLANSDLDSFGYLLDMSSHDFCTATHMINVGVGCGVLLRELDLCQRSLLPVVVQGGLLHDLGKRNIPVDLLQKEGRLTTAEWAVLREHPRVGHAELANNPQVPAVVLEMARDHHERIDGGGYPSGRKGNQIGLPARICAVVDVFDAITAARPYRKPTPATEALAIMEEGVGNHFDPDVFAAWQRVVRRMVEADPARSFPAAGTSVRRALSTFIPVGYTEPAPGGLCSEPADDHTNLGRGNRRGNKRHLCRLDVRAMFTRQGKPCGVEPEQWFDARIIDVSRRGPRLETPWPLSIGDLLVIELVSANGEMTTKAARVVRLGRRVHGRWQSGLQFSIETQSARAA